MDIKVVEEKEERRSRSDLFWLGLGGVWTFFWFKFCTALWWNGSWGNFKENLYENWDRWIDLVARTADSVHTLLVIPAMIVGTWVYALPFAFLGGGVLYLIIVLLTKEGNRLLQFLVSQFIAAVVAWLVVWYMTKQVARWIRHGQ